MEASINATLSILGKDSTIVPYRRELAFITGTTNSAILLSQILYWADKMNNQPFFKYKEPPQKRDDETQKEYLERVSPYTDGDSWTEELYITTKEFDSSLYRIAHNKNKGITEEESKLYPIKRCIHYWTTRERKTYYEIKEPELLSKIINLVFLTDNLGFRKGINSNLDIIQRLLTDTTTVQSRDCTSNFKEVAKEDQSFDVHETAKLNQELNDSIGHQDEHTDLNEDKILGHQNASLASTELREMSKKYKPIKKVKPEYICSKKIQPFIDMWMEFTKRGYKKNSDIYKDDCIALSHAINGKFFNENDTPMVDPQYYGSKLTIDDWEFVLRRFSLMRNNADHWPKDKTNIRLLSIKTFLYNTFSKAKMKSYFIKCLEDEPILLHNLVKPKPIHDPNPDYTDYIIKQCNKVFGWDLGNGDRATAIKCATRLPVFYDTNKHKILLYDIHYKFTNQQVDFLIEALERNQSPDYPAKPMYLYSDLTYSKILPEHLKRVGSM